MKKKRMLNRKTFWICVMPLFIFFIFGSLLTYFLDIPILFNYICLCIGAGITFTLVEIYAV